jgi:energy-coupling factor transporter ATP-binding protein EcfA2
MAEILGSKQPEKNQETFGPWRIAGKLLAAFSAPVFGSLVFVEWIKKHPILTLLFLGAYETAVFCVGILGDVWKRLKDRWLDAVAQWIDYRVQEFVSGYRRKYLEHVFYECRDFDVKGLTTQGTFTLELERVFVELSVDAEPCHEASRNPIPELPEHLQQGRHDIWEYLTVGRSLALIGAPGSGKSTLLRHIALLLARRNKKSSFKRILPRLPILLFLRSHAKAIVADPNLDLPALISSSEVVKGMGQAPPTGWFARQLDKGRCLVLLDGLDEVASRDDRLILVDWLDRQIKTHGRNLFVVTSRPYGYRDNPLSSVHTLTVRPFSSEQVRRFVSNWYVANEIISHNYDDLGVRKEAEKGTRDLIRRINGSEVLTALAVNPLLLTMIATVHKYRSELPGRRVELYREICEVFLGKRQDIRGVERPIDLTPSQKQCVLEPLAYFMMIKQVREISASVAGDVITKVLKRVSPYTKPSEFFKIIEDTSGLLLERESGEYAFSHKTFQEYLTARHCLNQHLEDELATRVKDVWWHETIRLYVADSDATQILRACFQDKPPVPAALVLAVECIEEAQQVDQDCRQELESILTQEAEDEREQRTYGEALLRLRLRKMIPVNDRCWLNTRLVTQAEYQVFLDERRAKNKPCTPDHWSSDRFPSGKGGTAISGTRVSDAQEFCIWLTERDGVWKYRLPSTQDLFEGAFPHDDFQAASCIGCWAVSSLGEQPYIACISDFHKEEFILRIRTLAEELWLHDVRTINRLVHSFKFHKSYRGSSAWDAGVIPFVLALNRDYESLPDYDRTIDVTREIAQSNTNDLTHAIDRVLSRNIDSVLLTASNLRLCLPHGRSISSYLDRLLPINNGFVLFVQEAHGYSQSDDRTLDRVRVHVDRLIRALEATYGIKNSGVERLMEFVFKADAPLERDLDYVRTCILSLIGYHMLLRCRMQTVFSNKLIDVIDSSEDVVTLFDLYLQLVLIEGRKRGEISPLGGILVARERLEEE